MVEVTFIDSNGDAKTVEADEGATVMQTAIAKNVSGIVGECGGAMMCATCHVYVDEDWAEKTGARKEFEEDMLEFAVSEVKDTSRLSCQITLGKSLDGLVIHLPEEQK